MLSGSRATEAAGTYLPPLVCAAHPSLKVMSCYSRDPVLGVTAEGSGRSPPPPARHVPAHSKRSAQTFNLRRSAPPLNTRVPGDSFRNHFKRKSKLVPGRRATRHGAAAAESRLSWNQREPFFSGVSRKLFRTLGDALLSSTMNVEEPHAGGAPPQHRTNAN